MKAKSVVKLILAVYTLAALFELLGRYFQSNAFLFVHIGLQLSIVPLLFYALTRERNSEDKSETISPKEAVVTFVCVGLMLVFIVVHALSH